GGFATKWHAGPDGELSACAGDDHLRWIQRDPAQYHRPPLARPVGEFAMDFSLTPEQDALRESVLRFGREHRHFPAWRRSTQAGMAFDAENWRRMAELGWLGIAVGEDD